MGKANLVPGMITSYCYLVSGTSQTLVPGNVPSPVNGMMVHGNWLPAGSMQAAGIDIYQWPGSTGLGNINSLTSMPNQAIYRVSAI